MFIDNASRPGRPHVTKVSDKEVFMIWEEPEHDGNSFLLAYRVDWHKPGKKHFWSSLHIFIYLLNVQNLC